MDINKVLQKQIELSADVDKVWEALVTPELIKQYLFGTNTTSDWKVGSEIIFEGEFDGKKYCDRGKILLFEPDKCFRYLYWSSFSGLEDKPENYSRITFTLENKGDSTDLFLTHDEFNNLQQYEDSQKNWDIVLQKLKEIVEQNI